jgi:N-acetylglucosaminyldiphosphoundecaprenol N-acetyl-beta-D-mannosaminyltransferase
MGDAAALNPTAGLETYDVLGVRVAAVQIPSLIRKMEDWINLQETGHLIVFANVHVITEAQHDEQFQTILNTSFNVPDGKPLIWIGRARGHDLKHRVYGPDLLVDFCEGTLVKGYRHFLYGGAPGVAEQLADELERRFPGNVIAGTYSPPFRPLTSREDAQVVRMINAARPDVLWVGLGCPKQEKWAYEHRERLEVPVIAAVGQAFDIHSGRTRQAPRWMRESGLEWLFRLAKNPHRLWKRYVLRNSEFLWRLAIEKLQSKEA